MKMKHVGLALLSAVGVGLTLTATMSIGFLSLSGLYLIYPVLAWAIVSMVLASSIEASVLHQNIVNGIRKIFSFNYLRLHLTEIFLNKLASEAVYRQSCSFLENYHRQKQYVSKLSHKEVLSDADLLKKKRETKRLDRMIRHAQDYMFNPEGTDSIFEYQFRGLMRDDVREDFMQDYRTKRWKSYLVVLPIIIASISCGFVTYSAMLEAVTLTLPVLTAHFAAFTATGITVASLTPVILGFSIVAGAAYCVIMYNTMLDLIHNESLSKMAKNVWAKLSEGTVQSVFYGLGVVSLVALGVFLTFATAGTWWHAVDSSVSLLGQTQAAARVINIISIFFYGFAQLAFNIQNTHVTVETVAKISLMDTLRKFRDKVFCGNPFRGLFVAITVPLRLIVFAAHSFAIGVMTDNFGNKWVSAFAGAVSEAGEDFHYVLGDKHSHDDDHGHKHSDIIGGVFKVVFFPLLFCASIWDWFLTKGKDEKQLTFGQSFIHNFSSHQQRIKPIEKPVGNDWVRQEIIMRTQKKANYYQTQEGDACKEKAEFFSRLGHAVKTIKHDTDLASVIKFGKNLKPTPDAFYTYDHYLGVHRGVMNSGKDTQAQRFTAKLEQQYGSVRLGS